MEYCAARGAASRGDSGSVSSGSTFLRRSRAMEVGGGVVAVSLQPEPPFEPLVAFPSFPAPWLTRKKVSGGIRKILGLPSFTAPLEREAGSQNRRPGVWWSAYSRSQRRCAHVGNLAMPGESPPLWGSPPQPGHHVRLPRRPGQVEGGRSSSWSARLPPPWRSPPPPTTPPWAGTPADERSPREGLA